MSVLSMATPFPTLVLLHVVSATLLGLVVWAACRFIRHPATRHALWLVVLIKMITPPWVELAILPADITAESAVVGMAPDTTATATVSASPASHRDASSRAASNQEDRPSAGDLAILATLVVLAGGSLTMLGLAAVRMVRFRRLIAVATPPSSSLAHRLDDVTQRIGLRQPPRLHLVDANLSPAVWPTWRGAVLLLPQPLLTRLDDAQVDAVLAHELAHLRRRDHWVRFIELAVTVLYWWHPMAWLARRELRRAEERACDGWVAATLPGNAKAYATGLLETLTPLTFDAPRRPAEALPATATGMNTRDDLEERLTMIITERTPKLLSPIGRGVIAAVALAAIAVVPIRADRNATPEHEAHEDAIERHETARRELERRAMAIEKEMAALEDQRMEIEEQAASLAHEARRAEIKRRAKALRAAGDEDRATALTLRGELFEKEHQLREQQRSLAHEARTRVRALDREAREVHKRDARNALEKARELAEREHERSRERVEFEQEHRARTRALQAEAIALRQDVRQREREAAESLRGTSMESRERQLRMVFEGRTAELRREIEEQIAALEAEHAQASGDLETEIAARIEALHRKYNVLSDL